MMDYASALMESAATVPDGLGDEFWLAPNLPFALRGRIETVFEVLGHLPLEQPLAVVADSGKTVAANAPLLRLLGAEPGIVGQMWSRVMPAWPDRARGFRRDGEQVFEEHLNGSAGDSVWVRVSLGPLAERGEQRAMAYALFISRPDVETVDHEEVRRLRKSLQLLADTQTDYVVEIDRDALMTFVSPSFCRALGASEQELIGRPFAGRVLAADQAGVAAAISEALRPPFTAGMQARLAAVPGAPVAWQLDAVIGDGIVGLDLVGRPEQSGQEAPGSPATPGSPAAAGAPATPEPSDPRLEPIARALEALRPGDPAGLDALARAVGGAAGAECVSYTVRRGDEVETALGWRLPTV
jgi:PAS domain-containing protein